ncbi:glycosyl hydrolase family 18 protein [Clostridium boliviensis]|uniref:chitinase n=1 Tax=Clostridium boliviensis TaxID=318465 RepID=A0ABU4GTV6_9CLOT|nr:glycosyl hydrolase family 18 protein [Clostridium boliviensis]MDW2800368.1 glycosyl hydrolase family 18 protein [Clostridium boliviensis]
MKRSTRKATMWAISVFLLFLISSFCNEKSFAAKPDRSASPPPQNLNAGNITDTSVTLTWEAPAGSTRVREYQIYKNNTYLGSTSSVTYAVNGLTPATTYQFYVKAKDKRNVSSPSNTVTVTTAQQPDLPPVNTETPSGKMVGYYAAWEAYKGYCPDQIDASKLTHINYAFANIGPDLKLTLGYPDIDPNNIRLLNELKLKNPNLKTLISVGGWNWSGRFSDAALTDASRSAFADSCVDFIVKYGFDGVDLDWEYPVSGGLVTNSRRPEDKQNFTLLLQKIREKLDARGAIDQKHYLLTIAGGADASYVKNVELSALAQYLDYANIMTYDLHGTWDPYTDLLAPLYNNNDYSPQYKTSVDSAVSTWLNAAFPADKLVMGVPFYGYLYSSVNNSNNGLYQTYGGANSISYKDIKTNYLNKTGYTRYFHSQSKVPWLFNGTIFISYEDPESIAYKADYIKSRNLGGAMIWELSQDSNNELLNTLYNGLK